MENKPEDMKFDWVPSVRCARCNGLRLMLNQYGMCARCWMLTSPEQRAAMDGNHVRIVENTIYRPVSFVRVMIIAAAYGSVGGAIAFLLLSSL